MKQFNFILAFLCLSIFSLNAQNVAINDDNSTGDANAILDVKSTTKGALFPRMTTAQRTTLGNLTPTAGMLVFDTETGSFWYFQSGAWVELATSTSEHPAGTILAYGGNTVPAGFLACDGSSVSSTTYPDLFTAIGTIWGGDGVPNFNLPDLRGRFPRGWDNGAGNDPDAGLRTALHSGGITGDNVGSYQPDEFKSHKHFQFTKEDVQTNLSYEDTTSPAFGGNNYTRKYAITRSNVIGTQATTLPGAPTGGNETRPKNAYVLYIIKY